MPYIPDDAEWYIAELVMECQVEGNPKNVVHVNLVLVRADSPEEAFENAESLGQDSQHTYLNPESQKVTFTYRGLRDLYVIYDKLEHGAELIFEEDIGVSEEDLLQMLSPKSQLTLFRTPNPRDSSEPDYSSKDIMDKVEKIMRSKIETD